MNKTKPKKDFIDSLLSLMKRVNDIVFEHSYKIAALEERIKAMEERWDIKRNEVAEKFIKKHSKEA